MDPVDLTRDDLERELVRKDKQALITDCLKIFDFNTIMYKTKLDNEKQIKEQDAEIRGLRLKMGLLESYTWWDLLMKRLKIKV